MEVAVYQAHIGSTLRDEDAIRIGEFLAGRFGEAPITTREVVDAAKPKTSPIHVYFEWDDAAAAEKYRLQQAGHLLRSIDVILTDGNVQEPTRAFHNVTIERNGEAARVYVPAQLVWTKPDLAEQVRDEVIRDLISIKQRLSQYAELAEYAKAVARIAEDLAA